MKQPIGTCIDNPFGSRERLEKIMTGAKKISRKEFLEVCDVPSEIVIEMKEYYDDFEYYKNGDIYFYIWSAIEHFYQ